MSAGDGARSTGWQALEVERVVRRTARVVSLFFPKALAPARAGQHVDVRLVAEDGHEARRSYSIASGPEDDGLELMIDRLDDGEVSPFLCDEVRPGDALDLLGPVGGHFVWTRETGGPLLLLAGGSGIAPLRAILRHRAAVAPGTRALLAYAARRRDDLVFRDEFVEAASNDAALTVVFATSREAAYRDGDLAGRLDQGALGTLLARWGARPRHAYVCGSTPFVETVASALVTLGLDAATVRTERYGGGA